MNLIQRIDSLLPQTQCGKCGHPGCRPYAEGIATGETIDKCPPGGDETIVALARLLGRPVIALDTTRGFAPPRIAVIREAECIGCTKCIQACPVDAIVGAAKLMHTVIETECTGCELCLAPCPVDCIDLRPLPANLAPLTGDETLDEPRRLARDARRVQARHRFEARSARLLRQQQERQAEREQRTRAQPTPALSKIAMDKAAPTATQDEAIKRARVEVTMSRARLSRSLAAFGAHPNDDQAATLSGLRQILQEAENALKVLLERMTGPARAEPTTDIAALKRAKVRLAMSRATLNKAKAANASHAHMAALAEDVMQAELALASLEP